jgi:hypothetical protein
LVPNVFEVTIAGGGACPEDAVSICRSEFDMWFGDVGLDDEFEVRNRPDDTPIAAQVAQCLPDDPGVCEGNLRLVETIDSETGEARQELECGVKPTSPFVDPLDGGGCSPYYKPFSQLTSLFPVPTCDCTCKPERFPDYASPVLPPACPPEGTGTGGDETGASDSDSGVIETSGAMDSSGGWNTWGTTGP